MQHAHWLKRGELKLLLLTDVFQIVAIYTDKKRISAARSFLQYTSQSNLT